MTEELASLAGGGILLSDDHRPRDWTAPNRDLGRGETRLVVTVAAGGGLSNRAE